MKYLQRFLKDRRAVSPVIGVILMVAITVVMAAGIAAWMYGYGMPKKVPTMAATLVDDPRVTLKAGTFNQRVAMLTILASPNMAPSELLCVVTYTADVTGTEWTRTLNGVYWVASTNVQMECNIGAPAPSGELNLRWVDSDGSGDISPGDRLDFVEGPTGAAAEAEAQVKANTDFTVKVIHKGSEAVLVSQTIKVY